VTCENLSLELVFKSNIVRMFVVLLVDMAPVSPVYQLLSASETPQVCMIILSSRKIHTQKMPAKKDNLGVI